MDYGIRDMKESKRGKSSKHKDRADMISNLPDPILNLILSGLPTTEEVVRTSILSRRWRYLWTSVPSIGIDYYQGGMKAPQKFTNNNFKNFVDSVLANKSIDLESFRLCCGNNYSMETVEGWIDAAVRRKVKQLDLKFGPLEDEDPYKKLLPRPDENILQRIRKINDFMDGRMDEYDEIQLPCSLVTCTSLEVLRLSLFGWPLSFPNLTGFSGLRILELNTCWLMKRSLRLPNAYSVKKFLKSCPLLEDLSLVNCTTFDYNDFRISCLKLKKLRIDNGKIHDSEHWRDGYKHMCLTLEICCPKLEYLELAGFITIEFIFGSLDSLKKAAIHPPKYFGKVCEFLQGISHVESLSLHFTNKDINLEDLPKSLPNLKTLELNMTSDVFNMNVVIRILISSPNIESLHLIIKEDSSSPTEVDDVEFPIGRIFERLKMVKMTGGITGALHEIGFIKFVLGSSQVLETFSINPNMNLTDEKLRFWTDDVVKFPRASLEAGFTFVQD